MKTFTFTLLLGLLSLAAIAQAPQAFNYQAVVRDNDGYGLANQNVTCVISILQGNPEGEVVFDEWHEVFTNASGLISLEIGYGEPGISTLADIDWGNGPFFLQLELDPTGGEDYQLMGTTQLLSVPYSLYSASTGDTTRWKKRNDNLYYKNGKVGIGTDEPTWWAELDVDGDVNIRGRAAITRTDETEAIINIWNTKSDWEIVAASDTNRLMIREWEGDPVFNIAGSKIGIGTTTPEYDLDIYSNSTSASRMRLATLDYSKSIFFSSGNENFDPSIYFQGGEALRFMRYDGGYNELLRITSDGKIGIGITDPFYNLEIMSSSTDQTSKIRLANLDNSKDLRLSSGNDTYDPHISFAGADALRFMRWDEGYNELMRITGDGKVGIGTTTPYRKFVVHWEPELNNINPIALFRTIGSTNSAAAIYLQNTSNNFFSFGMTPPSFNHFAISYNANIGLSSDLLRITPAGNVGIGTTFPTEMLDVAGMIYSSVGGFKFPDGTVQVTAATGGGSGNTLDQAYDQGGWGAGRTITADNGAVDIQGDGGLTVNGNIGIGTTAAVYPLTIQVGSNTRGLFLDHEQTDAGETHSLIVNLKKTYFGDSDIFGGAFGTTNDNGSGSTRGVYSYVDGTSTGMKIGVYGLAHGAGTHYGVAGSATGSGVQYGVHGSAYGTGTLWAGYFGNGDVCVENFLGVGTENPKAPIHVEDRIRVGEDASYPSVYGELIHEGAGTGFKINANAGGGWADLHLQTDGSTRVFVESGGNVGIGTSSPSERFEVNGTAKCKILKITGGADIAEPFDVIENENIKPGMVLVIDPENPGKLKLSDKEYDRCVAGIISGAGEINPGVIMGQTESIADGDFPVALSGRVYCYAETSNGNICPGDLITTSNIPGYAMKSLDYKKAQGAVIGKAMTSLESEKGLILVLVTLH